MTNRPYVREKDSMFRLVKGFKSSYRRMYPDRPSPTITTASSHIGSDYKIHPWENRILSIRECADIQTIPHFYNWEPAMQHKGGYIARQVVGEALPTWFAYLHGQVLLDLFKGIYNHRSMKQDK
jgi:DNA (cytosine-5)-methyltransferase 1